MDYYKFGEIKRGWKFNVTFKESNSNIRKCIFCLTNILLFPKFTSTFSCTKIYSIKQICVGCSTSSLSLLIDMATSMYAYSLLWKLCAFLKGAAQPAAYLIAAFILIFKSISFHWLRRCDPHHCQMPTTMIIDFILLAGYMCDLLDSFAA